MEFNGSFAERRKVKRGSMRNRAAGGRRYRKKDSFKTAVIIILLAALAAAAAVGAYSLYDLWENRAYTQQIALLAEQDTTGVYEGIAYTEINDGKPFFTERDYTTKPFEKYSELDSYGRCGPAFANICEELMPTEERTSIGMIKPSGWHTVRYDGLVEGNYLYNRCHLIAFALAGENANEKNLISGTRYMNTQGMLPFEIKTAQYVENTGNHVLYRVTPIFKGKNLVAQGVLMEASSVEDHGEGLSFCVYVYNVQPNIVIDYATGESEEL